MTSRRLWDKNREGNKPGRLWIIVVFMMLLGVLAGAAPASASTVGITQAHSNDTAALTHNRPGSAGTAAVNPLIEERQCSSSIPNWVHIDFIAQGYLCYGFAGTWNFPGGYSPVYFCSGNNSGTFTYSVNGTRYSFNFGPGLDLSFIHTDIAISLKITGYSGSDSCPSSPGQAPVQGQV